MRACLIAALLAAVTSSADAGRLLIDGSPCGRIFTFSMLAEEGETFHGFMFTYEGELNQQLAAGMSTPFTNFDAFLPGFGAEDSKFLFASGDVLAIGVEESANSLTGGISGLAQAGLPNPAPFARIVAPIAGDRHIPLEGHYRLLVDLGGSEPQFWTGILPCPEPASCMLAGLTVVGLATRRVGPSRVRD